MYLKNKKKYRNNKRFAKKFAFISIIILIILGAYITISRTINNDIDMTSASNDSGINYNAPTEEEKKDTENQKQQLINNEPIKLETTDDGRKVVTLTVLSVKHNEILAYVNGIFEDGGTCTATYSKDSVIYSFNSSGITNSNYTSCEPITNNKVPDESGWQVYVSYSSKTYSGKTNAIEVSRD